MNKELSPIRDSFKFNLRRSSSMKSRYMQIGVIVVGIILIAAAIITATINPYGQQKNSVVAKVNAVSQIPVLNRALSNDLALFLDPSEESMADRVLRVRGD